MWHCSVKTWIQNSGILGIKMYLIKINVSSFVLDEWCPELSSKHLVPICGTIVIWDISYTTGGSSYFWIWARALLLASVNNKVSKKPEFYMIEPFIVCILDLLCNNFPSQWGDFLCNSPWWHTKSQTEPHFERNIYESFFREILCFYCIKMAQTAFIIIKIFSVTNEVLQ